MKPVYRKFVGKSRESDQTMALRDAVGASEMRLSLFLPQKERFAVRHRFMGSAPKNPSCDLAELVFYCVQGGKWLPST
jgi:hypothetical protein